MRVECPPLQKDEGKIVLNVCNLYDFFEKIAGKKRDISFNSVSNPLKKLKIREKIKRLSFKFPMNLRRLLNKVFQIRVDTFLSSSSKRGNG
jgi:hypothetical protein